MPAMASTTNKDDQSAGGLMWKSYLYQLQQEAPQPKRILCERIIEDRPDHYGREFHGALSREEADRLLTGGGEGSYVVRESQRVPGTFTLGMRFNGESKNFKLYYDGNHYVGDKRFEQLQDLVADGLITMYVDLKAADYIAVMVSNPIYDKHSKFTKLKERSSSGKRRKSSSKQQGRKEPTQSSPPNQNKLKETKPEKIIIPPEPVEVQASSYEKGHSFKVHNFVGPHWCEYCGNFMWGLVAQGVKCTDCALNTHKQCAKQVPSDCQPHKKLIKRVYSVDLTTLVKAHNTTRPTVVDKCITEIERRGLDSEGLYRVSGFNDDIEVVRQSFDRDGENAKLDGLECDDINTITGVLKLYFRQLPIPLIPYELYPRFISCVQEQDDQKFAAIIESLNELNRIKPAHYQTLKYMIMHLYKVTQLQHKNLMNAENLGVVFGPTLMRAPDSHNMATAAIMDSLANIKLQQRVIELIILHSPQLFN